MKKIEIIKNIVLIIGIVVVLNLFFNAGIQTFYKAPVYEDFCKPEVVTKIYSTKEQCEAVGGLWSSSMSKEQTYEYTQNGAPVAAPAPVAVPSKITETQKSQNWCDAQYSCNKKFTDAESIYYRNVFTILVVLGLITLIVGLFVKNAIAVSLGLSFGGILSMVIGSIRYWDYMKDYLRFLLLGIALVALIWLGFKKLVGKGDVSEDIK